MLVRGRRTGRTFEVPVEVRTVWGELMAVSFRDRTWWRNFREQTETSLWLHGQPAEVRVEVVEEIQAVQAWLAGLILENPATAKYLNVPSDAAGQPQSAPLLAAAQQKSHRGVSTACLRRNDTGLMSLRRHPIDTSEAD